jgi:aryl-alcohol dehydrogenase-like predicted oxidoreductase
LLERNIENEYVNLALELGPALVAWSPLGGGMLSGKYKPSEAREPSTGRLAMMEGTGNPVFDKFSDRNWKIVQVLEEVAKEIGRSMPAVALNWVANRPAVGSVLVGASKPEQLKDNMTALDFEIPEQLRHKLDEVSEPAHPFPYNFFQSHIQSMVTAGTTVADRPESYAPTKQVKGVSQTDSDDS